MSDLYYADGYAVFRKSKPTDQIVVVGFNTNTEAVGVAEALNNAHNLGRLSVYENRTEQKSMFDSVFGNGNG